MSDTNTKVLLHFNAANNSTFVDDFGSLRAWSVGGSAKITTATKKFGRSCLYLDGETSYIYTAHHNDFILGLANFSFDFHIKFPVLPGASPQCIFSKYQDTNNRYYLEIYYDSGSYIMRFRSREGATLLNNASFVLPELYVDTFYHFEFTRSGTTFYLFQNGNLVSTVSGAVEVSEITGNFEIGRNGTSGYLNAYIDEFRYSYGIARHTSSFDVETYAYRRKGVDDEYTSILLHFNGNTTELVSGANWTLDVASVGTPSKFGSGALKTNSSGYGYAYSPTVSSGSRYSIWKYDCFTIDLWFYKTYAPASYHHALLWPYGRGYGFFLHREGSDYKVILNADPYQVSITTSPFYEATWQHLAIIKNNNYLTAFVDGVQGSIEDATTAINFLNGVNITQYTVGQLPGGYPGYVYIDELRISPAIKRWTADFSDALPSDEYGSTVKSAEVSFNARSVFSVDTLWDDLTAGAKADTTFFGQSLFTRESAESAKAADEFIGQYWKEGELSEAAKAGAEFAVGYYTYWPIAATANATFASNYVVFIDFPAKTTPFPYLDAKSGYNAELDAKIRSFILSANTGAITDQRIPFLKLSSTGLLSLIGFLDTRAVFPYLRSTINNGTSAELYRYMQFMKLNGYAYITGANILQSDIPFIESYLHSINSRDFSTQILKYVR